MADEEQTINAESFATLSEASFAKDWGSKEDRVYDIAEAEARLEVVLRLAKSHPERAKNSGLRRKQKQQAIAVLASSSLDITAAALGLARALRRAQMMPLLMKTWEKSSRDAAYDNIQEALADWDRLLKGLGDG